MRVRLFTCSSRDDFAFRKLLERDDVTFAGYKMPHPLKEEVVVSVLAGQGRDPVFVLSEAVSGLIADVEQLLQDLDAQQKVEARV